MGPSEASRKAPNTAVPPPCRHRATRKRWKSAILDFRPKTAVPPAVIDRDRRVKIPKTQAGVGLSGYVNNNIGNIYYLYIFGTLGTAQRIFRPLAPMHSADFIPENRVRVRHPSRAVPPVPLCQPYSHKGFRHRPENRPCQSCRCETTPKIASEPYSRLGFHGVTRGGTAKNGA